VTVQLIDAETGQHAWAERYDRQLEDVFAIQDEITGAIVSTLPGRIEAARRERAKRKPTENMAAYEYVLAGKVLHHRSAREDNAEAQRLLEKAIALDPKYAHAHAWRACVLGQSWTYNWGERAALETEITGEANTALALDDSDADVHRILGAINLSIGDFERAKHHQERALSLNPNYDLVVVQQGELLTWLGQPEEGIEWIRRAMRLNPFHPARYWSHLGRAYFTARRYAEAAEAYKRLATPDQAQNAFLAAATAGQGDLAAARACADRVLAAQPNFTVADYLATLHYRNEADREHLREKLLQAGLPA
jgi:adenylate cyclase